MKTALTLLLATAGFAATLAWAGDAAAAEPLPPVQVAPHVQQQVPAAKVRPTVRRNAPPAEAVPRWQPVAPVGEDPVQCACQPGRRLFA